jgi:hypothetical protein
MSYYGAAKPFQSRVRVFYPGQDTFTFAVEHVGGDRVSPQRGRVSSGQFSTQIAAGQPLGSGFRIHRHFRPTEGTAPHDPEGASHKQEGMIVPPQLQRENRGWGPRELTNGHTRVCA